MNRREALASLLALPAVERISRVDLHPTDTLVIESSWALTPDQRQQLRAQLASYFPGHQVIVLGAGFTLKVLDGKERIT